MAFPKEKLHEELKKQVEAMEPTLKGFGFTRNADGHYWDQFYQSRSRVTVKIIPVKERNRYGYYGGFKMHVEQGSAHYRSSSKSKVVGIENYEYVKKAIRDSLDRIKSEKESAKANASFKDTLEKTLPRLFPGRETNVYEGRGEFRISVSRKDGKGAWFDITIFSSGQISKVEISYPDKELPDVAKMLLEAW